jgi:hypothetical protein
MKKLSIFILFIFVSIVGYSQSGFQQHGNIPYGDMVAEVKSYRYNAGASPSEIGMLKVIFGTVTTSSGVATVQLTMDGLSTGAALFTNILSVQATAEFNTSSVANVPLGSVRSITSGKTLTLQAVESATVVLAAQGLEYSGTVVIDFFVIGY